MYGKIDQRDSSASNNPQIQSGQKMSIYQERDQNNNFFQYVLSVFGLATGYGSVWRLPFLIFRYGGGVFLIPYLILTVTVGIPIFYLETMLGQVYGKGPTQLYSIFHKKFKGFGIFSVLIICSILIYYNLIFSYNLFFLYESYNTELPWKQPRDETYPLNTQYFLFDFLHTTPTINETGTMIWMVFAFYVAGQVIVFFSKPKDAKQLGQLGIYSTVTPFIIMFAMLIRCFFLKGAGSGLYMLFVPNLDKLFSSKLWVDAGVQVLFQYTLGIGTQILYGAERNRDDDIIRPSYTIPLLTSLFGILCSAVIFSFLGYVAFIGDVPIMEVQNLGVGGHSLAFIVYPAIVSTMPLPNFFSIIFFGTLLFQGIDKQLYYIDCIMKCIEDEFKTNKGVIKIGFTYYSVQTVRFLICAIICFFGLLLSTQSGIHYLGFLDYYSIHINLLLSVTFQTIFFTWYKSWSQELEPKIMEYIKIPSPKIYVFLIKFYVPFILGFLTVHAFLEQLERLGDQEVNITILGWCITGYPLAIGIIVYRTNLGESEPTGLKDTEFEYLKYLNMDRQDSQQVLKKPYN